MRPQTAKHVSCYVFNFNEIQGFLAHKLLEVQQNKIGNLVSPDKNVEFASIPCCYGNRSRLSPRVLA